MATQRKKIWMEPSDTIAVPHIAVSPAAGPLTLNSDLLISGIINPPMIPAIRPE